MLEEVTPPSEREDAVSAEEVADSGDLLAGDDGAAGDRLVDWKNALRADVERWLASIDEVPVDEDDDDAVIELPDLYAFHEQLAASTAEARKANRRTAEAFSQWSDTLSALDSQVRAVREQLARQPVVADDALPRRWCLAWVELIDRLRRIADAFVAAERSPRRRWFGGDSALRTAWETQRGAFDILVSHAEALIATAGVTRIDTKDQPFDPRTMVADATAADSRWPPNTVLEELAPGYLLRGELLRVAHVKVSGPSIIPS